MTLIDRHRSRVVAAAAGALLVLATAGSAAWAAARDAAAQAPGIVALKFHADWCGSCKAMGPVFTDLANKFDDQPVLFVELDLTNTTTHRQAEYMAAALGVGELWPEYGEKTGFILLIDQETKRVVATLTRDMDIKQMGAALTEAVAASGL